MRISITSKVFSPESQQSETGNIFQWLQENTTPAPKDLAPLWSPTVFSNGSRKQEHALTVSCLVFDFDDGRPAQTILPKVGVSHLWHTSANHTPERPKWRLVIPLSEPVPASIWPQFWARAVAALGISGHDEACSNVGRFYYLPPETASFELSEGRPLPVTELLSYSDVPEDLKALRDRLLQAGNDKFKPTIRAALAGQPIATQGNRDNTVTSLGFYLGRSVCESDTNPDAVYRLLERGLTLPGGEPKEHWEKKFKASFEKGRAKRLELAAKQIQESGLDEPWASQLMTIPKMDGSIQIISNTYNAAVILRNEGSYRFRKNLLEDTIEQAMPGEEFRPMADPDFTKLANWLQKSYKVNLTPKQVYEQCDALAEPYDPLASYINSLKWDGVKRCETFLSDYFGCEDGPVTRLYSKKWLTGLVARALRPGCKLDTVLVLQGAQGLGKSTALRLLTEPWFSDSRTIIGDKDSYLAASRFWCHEFAELASLKRADLETMKAFFTSTADSYRPPYGRATVQKPRRCVYVASTNEQEFLYDSTGARRFWVVSVVNPINFNKIQQDRDQLIAEAAHAYRQGEVWWLDTPEERALQTNSAAEYQIEDGVARKESIISWWVQRPIDKRPDDVTVGFVCTEIWQIPVERVSRSHEMEAAKCLRDLGFSKVRRSSRGSRTWAYRPPVTLLNAPQRRSSGEVVDLKKVENV